MHLNERLRKLYSGERLRAKEAQALAIEISQGPVSFQVSRLMVKWGILEFLLEHQEGKSLEQVAEYANISLYAAKVLLEASLTIGAVYIDSEENYHLAKTGYFLLRDPMVRVTMDFNHDVNYLGLYNLEEALLKGSPKGLKVFGDWSTVYEGLSQLPPDAQRSWFAFDHFYSGTAFAAALEVVFGGGGKTVRSLLDVGGNTGRWATQCVEHDGEVSVTIMDLPQQCALAKEALSTLPARGRIHFHPANLLDIRASFPDQIFDTIWMSQFLDCFSMPEIVSILSRARRSMDANSRLCIMETLWDRQVYPSASYCLTMTSVYFSAIANGNSKMYNTDDLQACIEEAGLEVESIHDGLGYAHSIVVCKLPEGL